MPPALSVAAGDAVTPLDPAVAAILDSPFPDSEYTDSVYCVDGNALEEVEVLDSERLLFHGRRGRIWLNQLRAPCLGLSPGRALQFELRSNRYCQLDSFRPIDLTTRIRGAMGVCFLGAFEPITPNQAGLIRESADRYNRSSVRPRRDIAKADAAAEAEAEAESKARAKEAVAPGAGTIDRHDD
jgi:hypothetical protein